MCWPAEKASEARPAQRMGIGWTEPLVPQPQHSAILDYRPHLLAAQPHDSTLTTRRCKHRHDNSIHHGHRDTNSGTCVLRNQLG